MGGSTFINAGTFNISRDDTLGGTGEIRNDGTFIKSGGTGLLTINPDFRNEGLFEVASGTVDINGNLFQLTGETRLTGGTVMSNSLVFDGGQVTGSGTLDVGTGAVTFVGGELAPGASPGTITINGDLILTPSSVVAIELGGISTPNIDFINVTGFASLDGTLNASIINGYVPNPSTIHTVLAAASGITGGFASENISGAASFASNVQSNTVELLVTPVAPPAASPVFAAADIEAGTVEMIASLLDGFPPISTITELASLIDDVAMVEAPGDLINDLLVLSDDNDEERRDRSDQVRQTLNQCY